MKLFYNYQIIKKVVILLLFTFQLIAQENDSIQNNKIVKFEETFSLYYIIPNQIGNHTLAKDYKNRFGFGSRLTLVSIQNFNIGGGGEYISYEVTNKSNAGNFSYGNYKNAFILINYPIKIVEKLQITPTTAIGLLQFSQRERSIRYSHQNGVNYRAGLSFDYELVEEFDVFFGVEYIYTKFKLNANPEIIDYYGKSNQFQITIGIKFKSPK
ncbi:MAG: hypothetical protein HC854_17795 [Flavobacterium sp.]|nr:hypothetical protein [Flavobacterium sp.]